MNDPLQIPGGVPILGAPAKARAGVTPMALVTQLDPDGTSEIGVVHTPNGPAAVWPRESFMDANDLLDAMERMTRDIVREEIEAAWKAGKFQKS